MLDILLSGLAILQKGIFSAGPFLLLLGVLIFIHELGHFLAARRCGVTVEVFSLGFGPKILKYQKGETLYCLSLFPLGGYVKMFGDDPLKEIPESEKERGFLYKKVPQKLLIAFGGPFMNLLFTLAAFFLLGVIGIPSLPPFLGDIEKNSPAHKAGFRSGDKVLSVNGESISYWQDLSEAIQNRPKTKMSFEVLSQNGKIRNVQAAPSLEKNPNILAWRSEIGELKGLTYLSEGTQIGVIFNSPAWRAGLRTFDKIKSLNGKKLLYARDFLSEIRGQKFPLEFAVQREGSEKHLKIILENTPESPRQGLEAASIADSIKISQGGTEDHLEKNAAGFASLRALGIESPQLYIDKIGPGSPAEKAGLQKGDRLLSIDGKVLKTWSDVIEKISLASGAALPRDRERASLMEDSGLPAALSFKYRRRGKEQTVLISPETMFVEGNLNKRLMVGISSAANRNHAFPPEIIRKRAIGSAFLYSGERTWHWLGVITVGLVRLAQGKISFRTMGGPVAIGRVAHQSFHAGFNTFMFMMALISLNLFFLNLLPIPMLDGGHILFFSLEGLMGRPLDLKKLLLAQQAGLFFLIFFFGLVFFNDIYNWLNAW